MKFYDPVSAIFSGFVSVWSRMLLFFATCFLGHAVGSICVCFGYGAAPPLEDIPLLPAAWFFGIFQSFTHAFGFIYIPVLLVTGWLLGRTDTSALHSVVWLFPAQMWNTFVIKRFLTDRWDYRLMGRAPFTQSGYVIAGLITALVVVPYIMGVLITWKRRRMTAY